jgi:hypothetical protein
LQQTVNRILYLLIAIGTLAGLYGAALRYRAESRNRRVEIALDFTEVARLADIAHQPIRTLLSDTFKPAGVTSVAIIEDTLDSLQAEGAIRIEQRSGETVVSIFREGLARRIEEGLRARGITPLSNILSGNAFINPSPRPCTHFLLTYPEFSPGRIYAGFRVPADFANLRSLGVGLDPEAVEAVRRAGMAPIGRVGNFPGASPSTMAAVLRDLREQGVRTVIFSGMEVMGFRGQEKEAAQSLLAAGVQYGQIEFGKQKGDEKLSRALHGQFVRVHSIGEAEMTTLDESEAVDRFVRATRERNIRLCYIRLPTLAGANPVETNREYIGKIVRGVVRSGAMELGPAHIYSETGVPFWAYVLMAIGVSAGVALLLTQLLPFGQRATFWVLSGFIVLTVGAVMLVGETGRKLVALLAALVFPSLACLRSELLDRTNVTHSSAIPPGAAVWRALGALTLASGVTALGITHVIGLLATRPFMLKANQFMGIKLAHALPILLVGVIAAIGLPHWERARQQEWVRLREQFARLFAEPLRVGQVLLALVALLLLVLIVMRTGNESGVGVSEIELKFRTFLDRVLPVRPRTKEFLVGHPAFVLALALAFVERRKWAVPLFVVGVVGQVSLLNTFCHIHTPLVLSLIRAITGLVFGAVIGLALFWLVEHFNPTRMTETACVSAEPPAHSTGAVESISER